MSAATPTLAPTPLRVLHFNSLLVGGGTDDQSVKLAGALRSLGVHVWLAGPTGGEFSKTARDLGVPFVPARTERPSQFSLVLASARFIRNQGVEIVHGHHGRDLWPTILAARLSGRRPKVVLTRHLAKSPASWFSRRFLLGQCDAMIAVSRFVARVLREGAYEPAASEPERRARPPLRGDYSRIHVIHGGIDADRFKPCDATEQRLAWGLAPENFVFAVTGGYDLPRGKGQREFLQAAARVHSEIPQARFLLVGRGNMAQILRADIARLGLEGKAWLTPYARNMPAVMNALDCLVHPQVGTEAFPGVLLEAFACGRPVIASELDGIPEAFAAGACGRLVPPENIDALARALVDQFRLPALTLAQRQELHTRVHSGFSTTAMARQVLALYSRLLGRREQFIVPPQ